MMMKLKSLLFDLDFDGAKISLKMAAALYFSKSVRKNESYPTPFTFLKRSI